MDLYDPKRSAVFLICRWMIIENSKKLLNAPNNYPIFNDTNSFQSLIVTTITYVINAMEVFI